MHVLFELKLIWCGVVWCTMEHCLLSSTFFAEQLSGTAALLRLLSIPLGDLIFIYFFLWLLLDVVALIQSLHLYVCVEMSVCCFHP